ncbi:type II toxin-antitoxin system RelB/DinJ family antitoxin [Polynucleobacter sp. MWH-UH2A]|uniref:type II toxin-antitoxin system RelB/DinJ family antitoxin n=1 Tax=Polynucleobacter sp. MWH-UH2A TaxID=1855617 RepID=UPI001BFE6E8B|nr:type II toxin-antitoxin system RelB/DinJ family antitoxin [Polynucleobacter sp. MWH-UH2A]QWD63362.1 type II toxin-antitoxin system RelB/DinJ family antitoxin [Polynucleobacter sp. MWH-UH2A]
MTASAIVRVQIDRELKDEAAAVLKTIGLTPADALRILMTRVAREKALPFETLVPNKGTIAAMKEARKGKLKSSPSVDCLMADLNKDC